jgi:hypothetical protein
MVAIVRGMRAVDHPQLVGSAFHALAMACLIAWGGALIVRKNVL